MFRALFIIFMHQSQFLSWHSHCLKFTPTACTQCSTSTFGSQTSIKKTKKTGWSEEKLGKLASSSGILQGCVFSSLLFSVTTTVGTLVLSETQLSPQPSYFTLWLPRKFLGLDQAVLEGTVYTLLHWPCPIGFPSIAAHPHRCTVLLLPFFSCGDADRCHRCHNTRFLAKICLPHPAGSTFSPYRLF